MNVTKKEVNAEIKIARAFNQTELVSILEDYYMLKFSWVPQIIKRFLEPDSGGLYTPHRCTLKNEYYIVYKEYPIKIAISKSVYEYIVSVSDYYNDEYTLHNETFKIEKIDG